MVFGVLDAARRFGSRVRRTYTENANKHYRHDYLNIVSVVTPCAIVCSGSGHGVQRPCTAFIENELKHYVCDYDNFALSHVITRIQRRTIVMRLLRAWTVYSVYRCRERDRTFFYDINWCWLIQVLSTCSRCPIENRSITSGKRSNKTNTPLETRTKVPIILLLKTTCFTFENYNK